MRERLEIIYSEIPSCDVFADIGCDHGYISRAMIEGGKCRLAVASDISAECLKKAEKTLDKFIKESRAVAIVSDGFDKLPYADCALIAGMGGEETAAIISACKNLPRFLVLQPMKNLPAVREKVVASGYAVKKDYVFLSSGKFYDLIVAEKGEDSLSEDELEFGRTNIKAQPEAFKLRVKERLKKIAEILAAGKINAENAARLQKEKGRLEKYV